MSGRLEPFGDLLFMNNVREAKSAATISVRSYDFESLEKQHLRLVDIKLNLNEFLKMNK